MKLKFFILAIISLPLNTLFAQMIAPTFHPVNYNDSYTKTVSSLEVLVVGAGGGGGGADFANYAGGGGGGAAVIATIHARNINASNFTVSVGGGGGAGAPCVSNAGAGTAGANGGGTGGKAGVGGCSGGGGGGGGWSGISTGSNYVVVAGGGAGGGGAYESPAKDRVAPGGGIQTGGVNGTSMTGGNGVQYDADGGGGGGGGGGYYGGAGQNPNSTTYNYTGSGGANYANTAYVSTYTYYNGNSGSGDPSNGNAGGALIVPNATDFGYTNNKGAGGKGGLINSTAAVNGGNGIVIIRYKGPQIAMGGEINFINGYTVHTFTSSANFSLVLLPVKGAIAHYMANQFVAGANPTQWTDQTGNGYHATMSGITTVNNTTINNNIVLQGSTSSSIIFPVFSNWSNAKKYTIFVVNRYRGTNNYRIVTDNTANNWLTSHWMGHVGVAFHNDWITSTPNGITNHAATDWILFSDHSELARSNTTVVSKFPSGANPGFAQLAINGVGWSGEKSDFEIAELILYPKVLNNREIYLVETYLSNKYGIASTNDGLMLNLDATNQKSFDRNGNTWTDLVSGNEIQWAESAAPSFKVVDGISCFSTTDAKTVTRPILSTGYTNLREGNGAYSVMAIFKPNLITSEKMLVSLGPATSTCNGSIIHPIGIGPNGKFAGGACGGLGTWQANSGVTPTTNKFWCVTTTFTGGTNGTETLYVDGVFDKSATMTTTTPVSVDNKFTVGWMRSGEPSFNMDANVAVILYYNRALSATEVEALYNKYKLKLGLP